MKSFAAQNEQRNSPFRHGRMSWFGQINRLEEKQVIRLRDRKLPDAPRIKRRHLAERNVLDGGRVGAAVIYPGA